MRVLLEWRVLFARIALFFFVGIAYIIRQLSTEQIESILHSIPYRCPLRLITGLKCSFCGMTHSWIAIFRGELNTSFQENVFGLPLMVMVVFFLLVYSTGKKISINLKPLFAVSIVALVLYAVIRNLF